MKRGKEPHASFVIYAKPKESLTILLPFYLHELFDIRNVLIEIIGQDLLECIIIYQKNR